MPENIITKIKNAGLVGRGGASFPTATKWEFVKKAKGNKKYVICNASEGELGIFKDIYILKNHLERVFKGLKIAMDFLETREAYFNLNLNYYHQIHEKFDILINEFKKQGYAIKVYKEKPSYPGGEETALLNAIEGKRLEPRLKPPYPADRGLFGKPTLIHNVETLFNIADVADGKFENKRFYCISGIAKYFGVFQLPADWSVLKVLKETNNIPHFDYFVQIGGSASGLVLNKNQLGKQEMIGAGSIEIYRKSINPHDLLLRWFTFYDNQSCGKCTPCREGTFQLHELLKSHKRIPWKKIMAILEVLEETSFCALGKSVPIPVKSYLKNILKK